MSKLEEKSFFSPGPPLALTCCTTLIILTFYQKLHSVKRYRLAEFLGDITSIDGVMTSQIIRHDVKLCWRHTSVKNIGITF